MTTYTYPLSDFPGEIADLTNLETDIRKSSITVALDHIAMDNNIVSIVFKSDIDSKNLSTLDEIVSNLDSTQVIPDTIVKIKEEEYSGETQGHFQSCVIDLEVSEKGTLYKDITFPFPISLFSAEWLVDAEHKGDRAEFHIAPDTIVGAITQDVYAIDNITTVSVSSTVIDYIQRGYYVKFGSSENEEIGRIASYDTVDDTITFENPIEDDYLAGSYVFMTIKVVDYWKFTATGFNSVGESKIGASFIPSNTKLRLVYHNENDVSTAKIFGISIDYMY